LTETAFVANQKMAQGTAVQTMGALADVQAGLNLVTASVITKSAFTAKAAGSVRAQTVAGAAIANADVDVWSINQNKILVNDQIAQ
jgi:hypothetical protein